MPRAPHLGDRRDAGSELQVRAGAVQHLDVALGQQRLLGVGHPDAVRRAQVRRGQAGVGEVLEVAEAARQPADDLDLVAILGRVRVNDACVRCARDAPPLRAARASTTPRSAARTPRAAGRRPRRPSASCSARLSSIDARVLSCSRARHLRRSASIMHLPTIARRPVSASASNTTSVSCTVSIVSTVVVPESSSSAAASRAGGAQRRRRVRRFHRPDAALQPVEQRHVVGVAAEQRLAEMDVRLDEAGQQVGAARVDDRCPTAPSGSAPTDTIRPSRTPPRPATISRRSFIVRIVALRISVLTCGTLPLLLERRQLEPLHRQRPRLGAAPDGDQLRQDADGDLGRRDRADVEADRGVDAREATRSASLRPGAAS